MRKEVCFMPRKAKGVHARPEDAGVKNLPEGYADKNRDSENVMVGIMPIYKKGMVNRQNYKGIWEREDLEREIQAFFDYCTDNEVKVAKVGLSLWLGIGKSQMYEWVANPAKYGFKSEIMRDAFDLIEFSYIGRAEKYPTANLFLLRTSHGHVETSKLDINNTNAPTNTEDVNDLVSKLGLDKE
jgi:hypothetical protein